MEIKRNIQPVRWLISLVIIGILLNSTQAAAASSDWSDDFPVEGAPADWEFYAYLRGDGGGVGPFVPVTDEALHIQVRDGALMSPHYTDTSYGYNFAIRTEAMHNSTQAYGTWSFDWITSNEPDRTHIANDAFMFIGTDPDQDWNTTGMNEGTALTGRTMYGITMNSRTKAEMGASLDWEAATPGFSLFLINDDGEGGFVDGHELAENIDGTHHIDIQRNETGGIRVYYDQELIIDHASSSATVSEKILYSSLLGDSGIDNLVVTSVIDDPTTTPPITTDEETTSTPVNGTTDTSDTSDSNWQYVIAGGLSGAIFIALFWSRGKKKY